MVNEFTSKQECCINVGIGDKSIKKSLDKILHTDNLLNTDTGIKMTRNRLSVYYQKLGKVVGKKITTTLNRHRAVSNVMDVEKIKDLANTMGHSVVQAVNVYAKKN